MPPPRRRRSSTGSGAARSRGSSSATSPSCTEASPSTSLPDGTKVTGRPKSYDFPAYVKDFTRISESLPKDVPLVGPATGAKHWIPELPNFLAAEPRVRVATLHRYPLQTCFIAPSSPQYPTVAHFLSPAASAGASGRDRPVRRHRTRAARPVADRRDELGLVRQRARRQQRVRRRRCGRSTRCSRWPASESTASTSTPIRGDVRDVQRSTTATASGTASSTPSTTAC